MSDPAEPRDDTDRYSHCPLCDQELDATDELAKSRDFAAGLSYAVDEARERMAMMAERIAALEAALAGIYRAADRYEHLSSGGHFQAVFIAIDDAKRGASGPR